MIKYSTLSLLLILFASFTLNSQTIKYEDSWTAPGLVVKSETPEKVVLGFSISEFQLDDVNVDGTIMKSVHLPGVFLPNDEGFPDLPGLGRYIALPQNAIASLNIKSVRQERITNIEIAPAPRIPLDTEPGPLQYSKNSELYLTDNYYPVNPVRLSEPLLIRGVDAVILGITPFQYNPVTKELIVYRDIEIEVTFAGGNNIFGDNRLRSKWFDPILKDNFINFNSLPVIDYTNRNISDSKTEDFEYIIITPDHPDFLPWADSIKNFRLQQGIRAGVVTLTQIGSNTTNAIETYINTAYNTWVIPPVAVLFMADYGTGAATGTGIISPVYNSYCISDHIYADINGDHMAEIVTARITAQNAAQLATMINKFLNYERNPPTNPNFYDKPITAMGWQTERWFQLCSEVVNGFWTNILGKHPVRENAIYSGTPGGAWSTATNTTAVVNYFGPNGLGYIPANTAHLNDWGGNATRINTDINSGAFMISHRDHGGETLWGEPYYTTGNINSLNNNDPIFVLSINCLTGKFNYGSSCFSEVFHRHQKGALGLIAATETSYSFVNDVYLWGMFDNMWPNFLPAAGTPGLPKIMPSFGNVAGKYFLLGSTWPYNTSNKQVTYYLFHHHSDAFLSVYSEMPQNLTVSHSSEIQPGQTVFTITSDTGSVIGITRNGELIGSGDGTGAPVNITIPPLNAGDNFLVTVTKQNYYRYTSTVQVAVPVELTSFTADTKGNSVTLFWQTATETNNSGFEVEKSLDGINFTNIGMVTGNGTTTEPQFYTFTENNLKGKGKFYYRLKQIDYDGKYEYSNVIEVKYSAVPDNFSLSQNYPNPFNPVTNIKFSLPVNTQVVLTIFDAAGREVETLVNQQMDAGYYEVNWNASNYTSGMYIYRLQAGSFTDGNKMLLVK